LAKLTENDKMWENHGEIKMIILTLGLVSLSGEVLFAQKINSLRSPEVLLNLPSGVRRVGNYTEKTLKNNFRKKS
jgi:hypothetical protein